MTPYDSKALFNKLFQNSYFQRVDDEHPLELYLGVDQEGRKAIRFWGEFKSVKLVGTKAIAVKHFSKGTKTCIQFSLLDPLTVDTFYKFVDDLVDSSRKLTSQSEGYAFVINRYSRWKRMFIPNRDILSEANIMGLIGELHVLTSLLIPKYGEQKAIDAWSASEPTVKDFSIDNTWFEVKTIGTKSPTIHINSLDQLAFQFPGSLFVIRLEKMASTYDGLTLNRMVKSLMGSIVSPEALDGLQLKLERRGYAFNEKYDEYVYECKEANCYTVDERFPALKKSTLDEAIIDAEYDLIIEKLKEFLIEFE